MYVNFYTFFKKLINKNECASLKQMFYVIIVMLQGYFQMKANPGMWDLQLRDGRSKELYDISR